MLLAEFFSDFEGRYAGRAVNQCDGGDERVSHVELRWLRFSRLLKGDKNAGCSTQANGPAGRFWLALGHNDHTRHHEDATRDNFFEPCPQSVARVTAKTRHKKSHAFEGGEVRRWNGVLSTVNSPFHTAGETVKRSALVSENCSHGARCLRALF
ncbi:MAG: hypothetical protein IJB53_09890 [Mailhella sp.]|nr:hypothetical protein [Mailhella sp.]